MANLGYWEYNVDEGMFTFNDHFYQIFHTSVEAVGGYKMTPEEYSRWFLTEEDQLIVAQEVQIALTTTDPNYSRQIEHKIKYPNGEIGYISVHFFIVKNTQGQTIKTYGINQNITERKLAELSLKESEMNLQRAFEISAIGPCKYNIKHDRYEWTKQALDVIEFPKKDIPHNLAGFLKFAHPEDVSKILAEMKRSKINGVFDLEHRIHINGQLKWIRFKSHLEYDEAGIPLNSTGIVQDITKRKMAENELAIYQEHLEKLVRDRTAQLEDINKDLEAFAYSISHDLRGPVRHINGFANILKRKLGTIPSETKKYLSLISHASNQMGMMIDGLLDFSRLGRQEVQKSAVNLNTLILEVINSFKLDIKHRKIDWKIEELPLIHGDFNLLKIVFENLISNAIKYVVTPKIRTTS